ncbi:adenosine receptor A2a-like [Oculina patagonica]
MTANITPQDSSLQHYLGKNSSGKGYGNVEEELVYTIALCIANLFLSFTALIGNVLILITIWKTSSLQSAGNILLANLAVSDLAVGLVGHPLFIAALLVRIYNSSNLSLRLWVVFNTLISFLCGASFFTITAIGVDRLLALELHLRYKVLVTPFRVIWVIIFTWVIPGILSTLRLWTSGLTYNALSPLIFTLLVLNSVVYVKIYLIVRRHLTQIRNQPQGNLHNRSIFSMQGFKRSALNTFLVYILLLCCYLPYTIALQGFFAGLNILVNVRHVITTIVLLNSSLNPVLYCWRVREIRTAMKQLFWH